MSSLMAMLDPSFVTGQGVMQPQGPTGAGPAPELTSAGQQPSASETGVANTNQQQQQQQHLDSVAAATGINDSSAAPPSTATPAAAVPALPPPSTLAGHGQEAAAAAAHLMPAVTAALALQAPHTMFNAAAAAPSAPDPTTGPAPAALPPSSAGAPSVPSLPSGFESLALALLGLPGQGLGQGGGFELALLTMQAAAAAAAAGAGAGAGAGLLPAALLGAGLSLPGSAAGSSGGPFALSGAGGGLGLTSGAAAGVRASQLQSGPSSYSSTYRGVCRLEAKDVSQHTTRRGKGGRAGLHGQLCRQWLCRCWCTSSQREALLCCHTYLHLLCSLLLLELLLPPPPPSSPLIAQPGMATKYEARVFFKGRQLYLGRYNSEEEAARVYDRAAAHLMGR